MNSIDFEANIDELKTDTTSWLKFICPKGKMDLYWVYKALSILYEK